MTTIHVNVPTDLHSRIKAQAKSERRSLTQTIIIAIEEYLARQKGGK